MNDISNNNSSVTTLKGIGEHKAQLLHKLGIDTLQDLVDYYPRGYEEFGDPVPIEGAPSGLITVKAVVVSVSGPRIVRNLKILGVKIKDIQGKELNLTFFNQPYIKNQLKVGSFYCFRGVLRYKGNIPELTNPKIYTLSEYNSYRNVLIPKYTITQGLSSKAIAGFVLNSFENLLWPEDLFSASLRAENDLISHRDALYRIHFPKDKDELRLAHRRLSFEEFFFFILTLRMNKSILEESPNHYPMIENAVVNRFIEALPFSLTKGQRSAWKDIEADLTGPSCMNRLLQGDVGSGKTLIAVLGLLLTVANGYQGAMMAPTEVLAKQHFQTILKFTESYHLPFVPALLVGSMTVSQKKEVYSLIESGKVNVIIGTHALIQEKVSYANLGFVVTDEQHRFGVRQRESFAEKGEMPHVLVMSATPIPRTLAIVMYGDLKVSTIRELPSNRLPIKNCVVGTKFREKAYQFIQEQVAQGQQAYVICPQVEASEDDEIGGEILENVVDYTDLLRKKLPDSIRVDYLHGKMKAQDKNQIMERFAKGDIDVLVSTTVIEVGVDVPNASVILIENAERFGLAQLHQLRGRVGRGSFQSYCIFLSSKEEEAIMKRLMILNDSNDGFHIASEDLKLRGPGQLCGTLQSGAFRFQIADIYEDADVLEKASATIDQMLRDDPKMRSDEHQKYREYARHYMTEAIGYQTL